VESTSAALARLNIETSAHHAAADVTWRSLLEAAEPTRIEYARRLVATYGFEAPLEAALAYTPGLRAAIDVRARFRAGLVAQDLLVLGLTPSEVAQLPECFPMAPFGSVIEALGWMYVVERSTLLHADVRQHLVSCLPEIARATSYLDAYRDVAGARWLELGHALDEVARGDRERDALVAAAHAGFRCLTAWNRTEHDVVARRA
jgi:heme oxygenase